MTVQPKDAAQAAKVAAATQRWQRRFQEEENMFRTNLPLSKAFLDPGYLDLETKVKVSTEVRQHLQAFPAGRVDDGEYYLYTLHDPGLGGGLPFHQLGPAVDRHTKFKIFLSSLFYIRHGKEKR